MLTDTHCHLDFNKFDQDREEVIRRAVEAGVTHMLVPALELNSCRSVVDLALSHPALYAAIGFHPTELEKWNDSSLSDLRDLIDTGPAHSVNDIVAIGEIGLDYYWVQGPERRSYQRAILKEQLRFAQEVSLPVVIHMREEADAWTGQACLDLIEILKKWHAALTSENHTLAEKPGVLHSFNGDLETARQALDLEFYIGVTGPVTYKNAQKKRDILKEVPLSRLLIETDAPFLTPVPHRGRRNEPAFVVHIADKIAEIHTTTRERVAETTSANAARLFGWGG